MELSKELQADIAKIFLSVDYGRITFKINPDNPVLDYVIEKTGKLVIKDRVRKKPILKTNIA